MKIKQFIKLLKAMEKEHGDLDVLTANMFGHRREHAGPEIAYEREYFEGEEAPRFYELGGHPDERKGKKVCRV